MFCPVEYCQINNFQFTHNFLIFSTISNEKNANNEWHFHCMIWNGKTGEFQFYYDGYLLGHKITNKKLQTILPKAGNMSAGFKWVQDVEPTLLGGKYFGILSYLNMWSVELPERTVKAMVAGGLNINGNVMAWRNVPNCLVGNLIVKYNSAAVYFPGKIHETFLFTFLFEDFRHSFK